MILSDIAFYVFAIICVLSGLRVVTARNPVHSVLFLILAFFNAAGLFVLLGAEFLAMILVVVYVGAVAVLFLFVVMMLDIDFTALKRSAGQHLALGAGVGLVLLAELIFIASGWVVSPSVLIHSAAQAKDGTDQIENTRALGELIYTKYFYTFELSGLILLVAMIGAIVLTLRHRKNVRRQQIGTQIARARSASIELVKVTPGSGV